uniref:G-type lectin S-receptor-like serine/threonine-protein kinase At4g27290 n=1 Tax=Erigeron canadensis TaxID=72917 RepID=UPI001CB90652|nr:G-type lectin S-receptor-like serine/threonine-protein kinase At4g27290 [Erigeron canadensis]
MVVAKFFSSSVVVNHGHRQLCFCFIDDCAALDTISANQAIKDGETIVSDGETYELGFFSPGKSKNRYLGVWYKKISPRAVVWVANRETPINDTSGIFKVSRGGNLQIFSGSNKVIWSSNSTVLGKSINQEVVVQLLDTGNLVVLDHNSTNKNLIWQSFDYPCDTLLPGMRFGKNLVTGLQIFLKSWKSPDDPSIGMYTHRMFTDGYPQHFTYQGQTIISRMGPWNGLGFSGHPTDIPNSIYSVEFVHNRKEIYNKYELKSSVLMRMVMTWDGKALFLVWIERTQEWLEYADVSVDSCGQFALCGPYGSCSINKRPPCSCMEGFEPQNPKEWGVQDWSSGCKPQKPLNCGNGFRKFTGVKVPDTRRSWYNYSMTLGECEMACKRNCSCTAYASLDVRNGGNGCLLWFHELIDIREYDTNQSLYIRTDAANLEGRVIIEPVSKERKRIIIIILSISSVVFFLSAVAYACKKKKKWPHMRGRDKWKHDFHIRDKSMRKEQYDSLQHFSLRKVANATDNFSNSLKIGEGGFGPVYKGVLEDGQEVAVKCLSETSRQGLEEFKNEVVCIAKLQHRNLVKLLGYCIHKSELILIYEYLANKSLDYFLFDETRCFMLDWPKRFQIIQGIARGILYLHQDSRLQIVHRDLKAGNILLDSDMNPKISDFGLARTFIGCDATAKTKKVVGTYGYIPPEYAVHGHFSVKSDVFSFGVLVLEIISGRKNRGFSHEDHSDNLLGHAWRLQKENKSIEVMSASLRATCSVPEVVRSIHVALLCVQNNVEDRPTMLSVVLMLASESVLPQPKEPAFYTGEICKEIQPPLLSKQYMITNVYAR